MQYKYLEFFEIIFVFVVKRQLKWYNHFTLPYSCFDVVLKEMKMMHNTFSSQEWLKFIGKEKLQTFQDSFARVDNISLCFFDLEGTPLTVWSNSSLLCHQIIQNIKNAVSRKKKNQCVFSKKLQQIKLVYVLFGVNVFYVPCYYITSCCYCYGGGIAYRGA